MKKTVYTVLITLFIFSGCSSMPKGEKVQYVNSVSSQSAIQLERGNNEYRWNNYKSALNLYSKALTLASSVDWQEGIIRSIVQISRTLDQLNRGEDSRIYAETAREFQMTAGSAALDVLTLNRLGEWTFFKGDSQAALSLISKALAAGQSLESEEIGETWRIKAVIHKKEKDYSSALQAIDEALKIDEDGAFLGELASDYYIRSSILSLMNHLDEAIESMEIALVKDKFIENSAGIAMDLFGLGKIYEKKGDSEKAFIYYKRLYLVYSGTNNRTVPDNLMNSINNRIKNEEWLPELDSSL